MAVELVVGTRYVLVKGASQGELAALDRMASYPVAGAQFTQSFRAHRWDGRERLMKFNSTLGEYRLPVGMLEDAVKTLKDLGASCQLVSLGRPLRQASYGWNGEVVLRDYQVEVVNAAMGGFPKGTGILKMPIRSGKTITMARIIHKLHVRSIFLVPSQLLLHQSQKALSNTLQCDVGILGDKEWQEGKEATVASIQTLVAKRKRAKKLYRKVIQGYDLVVFDECHHLRGEEWRQVMMDFDCRYRFGLSATAYLDHERECERGVIWLKACCGNIRVDIPTSRLIEEGYLVRPEVRLYTVKKPDMLGKRWSATLYREAIEENGHRNGLISRLACHQAQKKAKRVLIVSSRLEQVKILQQECSRMLPGKVDHIVGTTPSEQREAIIGEFIRRDIWILIGTVFGEGVDIPEIDVVINAEGGRDIKDTVQRMRNLTPSKGKTEALFIDFMDMTNGYLAEHSLERLNVYRSESAFNVVLAGVG